MELRSEKLAFGYRRQAVGRDVDVRVRPREVLCLLGPNGSGKTTLIKLLTRLYRPDSGRILLDGRDLAEWDEEILRQRIGVMMMTAGVTDPVSFETYRMGSAFLRPSNGR